MLKASFAACAANEQPGAGANDCVPLTISYDRWGWSHQFTDFSYAADSTERSYPVLREAGKGPTMDLLSGTEKGPAVVPDYNLQDNRPHVSTTWRNNATNKAYPLDFDSWWPTSDGQMVLSSGNHTHSTATGGTGNSGDRWTLNLSSPPENARTQSLVRGADGEKGVTGHIRLRGRAYPGPRTTTTGTNYKEYMRDITVTAKGVWVWIYVNGYLSAGCYDIGKDSKTAPDCTARVYLSPYDSGVDFQESSYKQIPRPVPGCFSDGIFESASPKAHTSPNKCVKEETGYFPFVMRPKTQLTIDIFTAQPRSDPTGAVLEISGSWAPKCDQKCFANGGTCVNGQCKCSGYNYGLNCGVVPSDLCYYWNYDMSSEYGALSHQIVPIEVADDYGAGTTSLDIYAYIYHSAHTGFESPESVLLSLFRQTKDNQRKIEDLWMLVQHKPGVPSFVATGSLYAYAYVMIDNYCPIANRAFFGVANHPYNVSSLTSASCIDKFYTFSSSTNNCPKALCSSTIDDSGEAKQYTGTQSSKLQNGSALFLNQTWPAAKTDGALMGGIPWPSTVAQGDGTYEKETIYLNYWNHTSAKRFHLVTYAPNGGLEYVFYDWSKVVTSQNTIPTKLPHFSIQRCCAEPRTLYTMSGLVTDPGFLGRYGTSVVCNTILNPTSISVPAEFVFTFNSFDLAGDGDYVALINYSKRNTATGDYDIFTKDDYSEIDDTLPLECELLGEKGAPSVKQPCFFRNGAEKYVGRRFRATFDTKDGGIEPLDIHFDSDDKDTGAGFRMQYAVIPNLFSTSSNVTHVPALAQDAGFPSACTPLGTTNWVGFKATNFDPRAADAGCAWANRGVMTRAYAGSDSQLPTLMNVSSSKIDKTLFYCSLPSPSMVVGSNLLTTIPFNITSGNMDGAFSRNFITVPLCASVSLSFSVITTVDGKILDGIISPSSTGSVNLITHLRDAGGYFVTKDMNDPLEARDDIPISQNIYGEYWCTDADGKERDRTRLSGDNKDFKFDTKLYGWTFNVPRSVLYATKGRCYIYLWHSLDGGDTESVLGRTPTLAINVSETNVEITRTGEIQLSPIRDVEQCRSEYAELTFKNDDSCVDDVQNTLNVTIKAKTSYGEGDEEDFTYGMKAVYICTTMGGTSVSTGTEYLIPAGLETTVPLPVNASNDLRCTIKATFDSFTVTSKPFVIVRRSQYAAGLQEVRAQWVFGDNFVAQNGVALAPQPEEPVASITFQPTNIDRNLLACYKLSAAYVNCVRADGTTMTQTITRSISWSDTLTHSYQSLDHLAGTDDQRTQCTLRVTATYTSSATCTEADKYKPVTTDVSTPVVFEPVLRGVSAKIVNDMIDLTPSDIEYGTAYKGISDLIVRVHATPLKSITEGTEMQSGILEARITACNEILPEGSTETPASLGPFAQSAVGQTTFEFNLRELSTDFFRDTSWVCAGIVTATDPSQSSRSYLVALESFAVKMPILLSADLSIATTASAANTGLTDISFLDIIHSSGHQPGATSISLVFTMGGVWKSGLNVLAGQDIKISQRSLKCATATHDGTLGAATTIFDHAAKVTPVLLNSSRIDFHATPWPTAGAGTGVQVLQCTAHGVLTSPFDIDTPANDYTVTIRGVGGYGIEYMNIETIQPETPEPKLEAELDAGDGLDAEPPQAEPVDYIVVQDGGLVKVLATAALAHLEGEEAPEAFFAMPAAAGGVTVKLTCSSITRPATTTTVTVPGMGSGLNQVVSVPVPADWYRTDFEGAECSVQAQFTLSMWNGDAAAPKMPLYLPPHVVLPDPIPDPDRPGTGTGGTSSGGLADVSTVLMISILLLLLIVLIVVLVVIYLSRKSGSDLYGFVARTVAKTAAGYRTATGALHATFRRTPKVAAQATADPVMEGFSITVPPAVELI